MGGQGGVEKKASSNVDRWKDVPKNINQWDKQRDKEVSRGSMFESVRHYGKIETERAQSSRRRRLRGRRIGREERKEKKQDVSCKC